MTPPSIEELRNRMKKRGTENDDEINSRISIAKEELRKLEEFNFFNKVLVNDDFEKMYGKLKLWL